MAFCYGKISLTNTVTFFFFSKQRNDFGKNGNTGHFSVYPLTF